MNPTICAPNYYDTTMTFECVFKSVCLTIPGRERASSPRTRRRRAALSGTWAQIRAGTFASNTVGVDNLHISGYILRLTGHPRPQLRCHPGKHFHRKQQRRRTGPRSFREDPSSFSTTTSSQLRKRIQIQDGDGNQECQG